MCGRIYFTINRALRLTLLILAGIILLAAGLTWALLSRFIQQACGPYFPGPPPRSGPNLNRISAALKDELGVLARSFSTMTRSLKSHIEHLGTVTAEKERIATELHIARDIQASMLPSIFPPIRSGTSATSGLHAARQRSGRRFFDFFFVDDTRLAIVIADVPTRVCPPRSL